MPYQIVVKIFCGHAIENGHEFLQLAMVVVDVLNVEHSIDSMGRFYLDNIDTLMFSKRNVAVHFVRAEN